MAPSAQKKVGRPPDRRSGEPFTVAGRTVVAGAGSHERRLSPRASAADLWSSLDSVATPEGSKRISEAHGVSFDAASVRRLGSFINQAEQYYGVISALDPVAKPLLGYYFVLNLAKAYLTVLSPQSTAGKLLHGASDAFVSGQRYRFTQEKTKLHNNGVARQLAANTGRGFCWPKGETLQISRMVAYLAEGADLYSDALGKRPKLLPVERTSVWKAGTGAQRRAWLTVDISRLALQERSLTARGLLDGAKIFGSMFQLVHDEADSSTVTYESATPKQFGIGKQGLPVVRQMFDECLILRNRSSRGGVDHIVLSGRPNLLSMEALTFLVLHHLSNMVRYRPQHVESLRGGPYWWLFTSWVDRSCENFLLSMASRISLEEHVIE